MISIKRYYEYKVHIIIYWIEIDKEKLHVSSFYYADLLQALKILKQFY